MVVCHVRVTLRLQHLDPVCDYEFKSRLGESVHIVARSVHEEVRRGLRSHVLAEVVLADDAQTVHAVTVRSAEQVQGVVLEVVDFTAVDKAQDLQHYLRIDVRQLVVGVVPVNER